MVATLTIPLRIVSEANGAHGHWAAKAKRRKKQRATVALAWIAAGLPRNRKPAKVLLTRIAPRTLDTDGCVTGMKSVRDEVAALCGFDDKAPDVEWQYAQEKGPPKTYGVRVEVTFAGEETRS